MPNSDVRVDVQEIERLLKSHKDGCLDDEGMFTHQETLDGMAAQLKAVLRSHAALVELREIEKLQQKIFEAAVANDLMHTPEIIEMTNELVRRREAAKEAARKCVEGSGG